MNLYNKVDTAIHRMVKEFQENPYVFIYEADIQSRIYCLIMEEQGETFLYHNEEKITIDNRYKIATDKTALLHTQLRIPERRNSIDIGIWDFSCPKFYKNDYKEKPLLIGIEIKYIWAPLFKKDDNLKLSIKRGLMKDYDNLKVFLKKKEFLGYALWFFPELNADKQLYQLNDFIEKNNPSSERIKSYIIPKLNSGLYINGEKQ